MVLTGSCPWPEPWFRTYGAHLHLQAREDPHPTAMAVPPTLTIASEKRELRERARERRLVLARDVSDFAERVAGYAGNVLSGAAVGGYRALAEEADPARLLEVLGSRGCEICYPRIHTKAHPLNFHVPVANEPWLTGAFGIPEPRPDWPRAEPSVLLVPLLAFDAEGYRLGYGGGYYDRTLAHFRAQRSMTAIGVAFAGQEVPRVPREPNDQRLDMIVTEQGIRRFPKA
jgi:5-formyltetrahydrofolate cyclo-ligase